MKKLNKVILCIIILFEMTKQDISQWQCALMTEQLSGWSLSDRGMAHKTRQRNEKKTKKGKTKLRVLITEDQPDIRKNLAKELKKQGMQVYETDSQGKSFELFKREKPDAVILDLNLGDMGGDGANVLRKIREIDKEIPVLIYSGSSQRKEEVLKIGATAFLDKMHMHKIADWIFENTTAKTTQGPKLFDARENIAMGGHINLSV